MKDRPWLALAAEDPRSFLLLPPAPEKTLAFWVVNGEFDKSCFPSAQDDDLTVCLARDSEFGVGSADQAAFLGDDHADPEPLDGGEVLSEREGTTAGNDSLLGNPSFQAGGQRFRCVGEADGQPTPSPMSMK